MLSSGTNINARVVELGRPERVNEESVQIRDGEQRSLVFPSQQKEDAVTRAAVTKPDIVGTGGQMSFREHPDFAPSRM